MRCSKCLIKLTKKNRQMNGPYIRKACKKCLKEEVAKFNKKRKKAIDDNKWF